MHLRFWTNIFSIIAVLNAAREVASQSEVKLSNTTTDGRRITWTRLSQLMKQVDTGITPHVWAIDENQEVYFFNQEEKSFEQVSGRNLMHVTSGEAGVWGVDEHGVTYRDGVDEDNPRGDDWKNIKGGLKQLDSGPKGIVCGLSYSSRAYCRAGITEENPTGTKWLYQSATLNYLSCGDFGCWGVNRKNDVYFANQMKARSTRWTRIGCEDMVQIEAGPGGQVWAVNPNGALFTRIGVSPSSPSGLSWQKMGNGNLKSATIGLNKVFAVGINDTVYMGSIVHQALPPILAPSNGYVFRNAYNKRCLMPESLPATVGTKIIHLSNCKDSSAFFRILDTGAIQHVQSGLCIHLSGNRECARKREVAILKKDCSDSRYFFKYGIGFTNNGINIEQSPSMCLGPISRRWPEGTALIAFPFCDDLISTYDKIDITKGCDLECFDNIIKSKKNTNSFEEFYKRSEVEAKSLVLQSSTFISNLRKEIPELYKDLLSTFFPVDPKVVENLEILVNHFGMEKAKAFPSMFIATAFIRRREGVDESVDCVCGGTGVNIGGKPAIDEEDAEYKLSLSEEELRSLLDDEDYAARQALDKEREEDEKAGINTDTFNISSVQKLIDYLESKYYYKFWTPESIKDAMEVCGFTNPKQIKFPPRGPGMSGIEYLEYYFSRDPAILPQENLKFPWPLAIALHIQASQRQCEWIWNRRKNNERIVRYSKYTFDYNLKEVKCKESDWNPCSIPRIIEDGGVCGRQSTLARVTNHCLGIASGGIKQPGHAAGYTYIKLQDGYKFKLFQSIKNMLHTYSAWYLIDDNSLFYTSNINAEYHQGLTRAMNHGYESYRNGRIALLIFSRIYDAELRHNSRDLLVEALEDNPHMMDVWMKIIHDVTGSNYVPREGQNVVERIPTKCPHFDDSQRAKLEELLHQHLSSYMQMYLEVLLRLISPPACCSVDQPKYLKTLSRAWTNKKQKVELKGYIFDAYLSCISKSASISEIVSLVQEQVLSETKLPEVDAFAELLNILSSIINSTDRKDVLKQKSNLISFFTTVCGSLPRFHVTASAWVIAPHYRVCMERQLDFLKAYVPKLFENVFKQWTVLSSDKSIKSAKIWNEYYLKGWLYGRTGDIIPLLVGVKESYGGGLIRNIKENIARNKSTIMSSQLKTSTSSENAVDGNTDQSAYGGSCAITRTQTNPWFQIDLQEPMKVYGLLITNVVEKFRNNLNRFDVHIGNNTMGAGVANPRCGHTHSMPRGETRAIYCDPPLEGRYITINIHGRYQVLALCEVEVYLSELASYRANGVKLDVWYKISKTDIERLYQDPRYPQHPDYTTELSTFDYSNIGSRYGSRLSAVYQPLESGNYTFFVACTDQCEVFLRDGESGGTLRKIISLKKATKYRDWGASDEQKSLAVYLEKGKCYEIVATLKEYISADYITVAVELPSGEFIAPIPAEQLFIDTKEENLGIVA